MNKPMIRDERGRNAQSNDMKRLFGLDPKAKWPDHGADSRIIQGVRVWIESKERAKLLGVFHRVRCLCPNCNESMSAGRLFQHKCKE